MQKLSRQELTAALAARQMLIEREPLAPAEAVKRLGPLQAQHPPAPYIALFARVEGFTRAALEAAIDARAVVKSSLNRITLHLAAAADYPAYAQLILNGRVRWWTGAYPKLDHATVVAELRAWFEESPRTNAEIREHVWATYEDVGKEPWDPIMFVRLLIPLVQLPPAGFWSDDRKPRFAVDPRPLPHPAEAAATAIGRYLAAFGPASRRDMRAWAGVAQRDFAPGLARLETVSYRDERGTELLDLRGLPLPRASTRLPVRFLARWDQALLAHEDRERIIPDELKPLRLTLSGDPTVTVDGRVAATWKVERSGGAVRLAVTPRVEIARAAREEIRSEGERVARFCEPEGERFEVAGV